MRVLVVGAGGREHALIWKLNQSKKISKLFIAPGNGGTIKDAINVPIEEGHIEELVNFAKNEHIDLVIPGPELPLTLGIVDSMQSSGIACFGPSKWCAQLEGSKAFAKQLMVKTGVPTANYGVFQKFEEAEAFIRSNTMPIVIKVDGLAAGKGVIIAQTEEEALQSLQQIMQYSLFGKAGSTVVIEEFLHGEEVSLIAFCAGQIAVPLPSAQDHKAAFDGDNGPNTGGMGAYSPSKNLPDDLVEHITDMVIRPILNELYMQGTPYTGILYAGLMMTKYGPKVLEYNIRFGDPECQPLLMRLKNDLVVIIQDCLNNKLEDTKLIIRPEHALDVVLVAEGYPGSYSKEMTINQDEIEKVNVLQYTHVFQAGTKLENGVLYSNGGRILNVCSCGSDLFQAQQRAYNAMKMIHIKNTRYRTDIGAKGLRNNNEKN